MKVKLFFVLIVLLFSCKTITPPNVQLHQYEFEKSVRYKNDTLEIYIQNPLYSPLRIWISSNNKYLEDKLADILPLTLESKSDTTLFFTYITDFNHQITINSRLGSLSKEVRKTVVDLPFPSNKSYRVLQPNNSNFTHNTDWSRYALDFDLKTNDTVCSATNGYVVGMVDQYEHSGKGIEWKPFANFITVYNPESGVFYQYVHLVKNGSLVSVGDEVKRGQPIALSGNTGQSTVEHLHFNCLVPAPTYDGLVSIPFEFVGGHKSENLRKGEIISHNQLAQ